MKRIFVFLVFLVLSLFGTAAETRAYDNVTIVIDPGHGGEGEDKDAVYGAVYSDRLYEKNIDLITAKAMYDELSQYPNLTVYMTREDDREISLKDRIDFAQSVGADLVISVHYNASSTHLFYGAEVFTSAFGNCYTTGFGAASCIMKRWKDYGLYDKGIKTRLNSDLLDYYGVIRHGKDLNVPVIILEHGYLDNHIDQEKIGSEEEWRRLGRIDAEGIADYYGIQKNVMSQTVTPSVDVKLPDNIVYPDESSPENVSVKTEPGRKDPASDDRVLFDYTITCDENESRLMYYNAAIGNIETVIPEDFADLKLWGDRDMVRDTISLPAQFSGSVVFRVYNIYGLYTDYETTLQAPADKEGEEENGDEDEKEVLDKKEGKEDKKGKVKEEKTEVSVSENMAGIDEGGSGIVVENDTASEKGESGEGVSQAIAAASSDSTMIYGLIFILATIVFILLIIIVALIKQGMKEGKDEDDWA
ncbi:MAG TPA: hypothetical protein DCW47_04895 [Lachnospiraceae bacterium]|nr:hypothetical protein [Lachnospiraceae bacterium]